jgi:hypothetical protein
LFLLKTIKIGRYVDTAISGKWALTNRPVRASAGVYTKGGVKKDAGRK